MNTVDYMKDRGVSKLFSRGRYSSDLSEDSLEYRMRTAVLNRPELIMDKALSSLDGTCELAIDVFNHAKNCGINLFDSKDTRQLVEKAANALTDESQLNSVMNGYKDFSLTAAEMIPEYKWDTLFNKVYPIQKTRSYAYNPFRRIAK